MRAVVRVVLDILYWMFWDVRRDNDALPIPGVIVIPFFIVTWPFAALAAGIANLWDWSHEA